MPELEWLWKLQWRVANTGNLPMGVTLPCIWLEAGFGKRGCFESDSGLSKWKEHSVSQRRCQRAVPGQQGA